MVSSETRKNARTQLRAASDEAGNVMPAPSHADVHAVSGAEIFLQFGERIRLQQTRLVDNIELPIGTRTPDARMFPGVMVRSMQLDIAFGRRECKIRGGRDDFLHVQAFCFFDRKLPE